MARQAREASGTGIYHVMLRGINRQNIFEDEEDYRRFLMILFQMVCPVDEKGYPLPSRCIFYAYCLMPNHVHLLVREASDNLPDVVKRIGGSYAQYFNKKYQHFGHLFQDRFKSEPVNDNAYFFTLLRYIHQNPIAAGLCNDVESYEWSSWFEFTADPRRLSSICAVGAVLKKYPLEELREQVNIPLPKTLKMLEYDSRGTVSDEDVRNFLSSNYGIKHPADLALYDKDRRNEILKAAKDFGASIRQLARLTSLGYFIVQNA